MLYVLLNYLFSPLISLGILLRKRREIKNILVIQTAKIGDMVCTTPLFKELKKHFPDSSITVLTNPTSREVIKLNSRVDEIIFFETKDYKGLFGKFRIIKELRKRRFDLSLCLNPNVPLTFITLWALIPNRIGILPDSAGLTYRLISRFNADNIMHPSNQSVSKTYLALLEPLGIKGGGEEKEVFFSEEASAFVQDFLQKNRVNSGDFLVGIAIASGNKLKEWGPERFAELADRLADEHKAKIVLLGAAFDKETSSVIKSKMKNLPIDACSVFSLMDLPAFIQKLSLIIGVDSGPLHIAEALGIPLVMIAGPSNMQERPFRKDYEIVQKDLPCVPCVSAFSTPYFCKEFHKECLELIRVEEVLEAIKRLKTKLVHVSI